MDEVFQHLGRLYYDVVQSQKVIENLKQQLEEANKEVQALKQAGQTQDILSDN
jgi:cell division protein FtsB